MYRIVRFYLRLISKADRTGNNEALAGWSLVYKKSYRNPSQSRVIGVLSSWMKTFGRTLFAKTKMHQVDGGNDGFLVWDNRNVKEIRVAHIRSNNISVPGIFIARNEIAITGFVQRLNALFSLFWFLPGLTFRSLFSANPAGITLLPFEWYEASALMQIVKTKNIRAIYFYCPYEVDANALFLLLHEQGVKVTKIPSPNLLSIGNSELLADELILSSPCQLDELELHKSTLRTASSARWLPEQFIQYAQHYKVRSKPASKTIGYYSHGSWLRNADVSDNVGDVKAELALLPVLAKFLQSHSDFSCTVFLHPKEKKTEMSKVNAYYAGLFGDGRVSFAAADKSGAEQFDTVDIGVGALSTILFERLFLGNKTIFYPAGVTIFPVPGSAVSKICANTEIELEQLILQCAGVTASEFRKLNDLDKYTLHEWFPETHYGRQD